MRAQIFQGGAIPQWMHTACDIHRQNEPRGHCPHKTTKHYQRLIFLDRAVLHEINDDKLTNTVGYKEIW